MCIHTCKDAETYQIWTLKQANQNDWPKETQKCPIKVIQTTTRVQLSNSPPEPARVSVHICCTLFPPNKHLFTTFHLVEIIFLQSQRARALSLTTGLVAEICCFHCHNLTSISSWEPKPRFKLRPPEINIIYWTGTLGLQTLHDRQEKVKG